MNYKEAVRLMQGTDWHRSDLGLNRIRELLKRLGNPQERLHFIHVAGTNGKGSVCAMLSSVLQKAGYRTGLFTSPHLRDYAERIQINGEMISRESFCWIAEMMQPAIEAMEDRPTEFECFTAAAVLYFNQMHCDVVVFEVGLGGRLDATNIISSPDVAIITNIGLEHTEYLGDTLEKIAAEKAGIIKPGTSVIMYTQTKTVEDCVRKRCTECGCSLTVTDPSQEELLSADVGQQTFRYKTHNALTLKLAGTYQYKNAAVVLDCIDVMRDLGYHIPEQSVQDGFLSVRWSGRFELLCKHPQTILDGAHNPNGVEELTASLRQYFPGRRAIFVMGVMSDKNRREMLRQIAPTAKELIVVKTDYYRAAECCDIIADAKSILQNKPVKNGNTVSQGIRIAMDDAQKDDIVCIFGSLYQIDEVKRFFEERE